MLISKSYTNKNESAYECDRCHIALTYENKIAIYTAPYRRQPSKKWDLCPRCYRSLQKGIAKGIN